MKDLDYGDESERLFRLLQDRTQSASESQELFEQLLALGRGFWYPKGGLSLMKFMHVLARAAQSHATALGARRDAVDQESLAHDVLLAFFFQTHKIRHPRAWLIATTRRRLARQLGKEWHVYFGDELDAPHARQLAANDGFANHELHDERMRRVIDAMNTCLKPTTRLVLELHLEGKTSTEIGEILGLNPATVRKHISRATARLARALQQDGQAAADRPSTPARPADPDPAS